MADDAVVLMMFCESGAEGRASVEFTCSKNGRGVYYPKKGLSNTQCTQDVWRVLSCSYDGIKIQESRMRENLTYGLTRGKGETDSSLRSFSYSTVCSRLKLRGILSVPSTVTISFTPTYFLSTPVYSRSERRAVDLPCVFQILARGSPGVRTIPVPTASSWRGDLV